MSEQLTLIRRRSTLTGTYYGENVGAHVASSPEFRDFLNDEIEVTDRPAAMMMSATLEREQPPMTPVKDGPSCPGCGLANYDGLCPHCRGDQQAFEVELVPPFESTIVEPEPEPEDGTE
jgi:hypothetical protein